jgi:hypothetical protein
MLNPIFMYARRFWAGEGATVGWTLVWVVGGGELRARTIAGVEGFGA